MPMDRSLAAISVDPTVPDLGFWPWLKAMVMILGSWAFISVDDREMESGENATEKTLFKNALKMFDEKIQLLGTKYL